MSLNEIVNFFDNLEYHTHKFFVVSFTGHVQGTNCKKKLSFSGHCNAENCLFRQHEMVICLAKHPSHAINSESNFSALVKREQNEKSG